MLPIWCSPLRPFWNRAARRKQRGGLNRVEAVEVRQMLAATGIVVNNGGMIVSFSYSGGTFTQNGGGGLPIAMMPSPGMPPMAGPNGYWEYVGTGDVNGDGRLDVIAKTSGVASTYKILGQPNLDFVNACFEVLNTVPSCRRDADHGR